MEFFGGEVEVGENFHEALRRELIEEIEYSPKLIESEIFSKCWKSIDLHYFPIFVDKDTKILNLNLTKE